jgi:mannose-6-phosphate isomerase-like protein (cupin superfamily)
MLVARSSLSPVMFEGLRIFDYTAGQPLGSSLALIEVPPGVRHKEAWSRRSDKYYLVVAGNIRFVLDGTEHVMSAGDFCFVKQGRRFSYSNQGAALATLVLVHTPSFDLGQEVLVERIARKPNSGVA